MGRGPSPVPPIHQYEDRNGNGKPDGADTGVSGLLVTLTPVNATLGSAGTVAVLTTFTDAFGVWQIDSVSVGNYTVKIVASSGVSLEQPVETALTVAQRRRADGATGGGQSHGASGLPVDCGAVIG